MNTLLVGVSKFDMGAISQALDVALPRNPLRDFEKQKHEHLTIVKLAESFKGYSTYSDLDHVSATMLIECSATAFLSLAGASDLRYSIRQINPDTILALVSGTLKDWLDATIRLTEKERDLDSRKLGGAIQVRFDEGGFGRIWKDRTTFIKLNDKTYTIKPRD